MILCDDCKAARALARMDRRTTLQDVAERIVESATGLVGGPTDGITAWSISCEDMAALREQVQHAERATNP